MLRPYETPLTRLRLTQADLDPDGSACQRVKPTRSLSGQDQEENEGKGGERGGMKGGKSKTGGWPGVSSCGHVVLDHEYDTIMLDGVLAEAMG